MAQGQLIQDFRFPQEVKSDLRRELNRWTAAENADAFLQAAENACAAYASIYKDNEADPQNDKDLLEDLERDCIALAKTLKRVGRNPDLAQLLAQAEWAAIPSKRHDCDLSPSASQERLAELESEADQLKTGTRWLIDRCYSPGRGRRIGGALDQLIFDLSEAFQEHLGKPSSSKNGRFTSVLSIVLPTVAESGEIGERRLSRILSGATIRD